MHRKAVLAGLAPALMLHACDRAPDPSNGAAPQVPERDTVNAVGAPAVDPIPLPPPRPDGAIDAENDGFPNLAPARLAPSAETTARGARHVLLSFARAIELREYDQAWAMLGPTAKSQWPKPRLDALFDGLRGITVAVAGGTMEGAAGSSYYTTQAEVTATDRDGRPIRLEGPVVLRRVADVPGATPDQLRWRIERADLTVTH